ASPHPRSQLPALLLRVGRKLEHHSCHSAHCWLRKTTRPLRRLPVSSPILAWAHSTADTPTPFASSPNKNFRQCSSTTTIRTAPRSSCRISPALLFKPTQSLSPC